MLRQRPAEGPQPEDYIQAIHHAFEQCPQLRGLKLVSAGAQPGFATVTFEGPATDFRGPFGAVVRLPAGRHDNLWSRYADRDSGTVNDWAHAAVALRAVNAHAASHNVDRGYTEDGVWWLIDETKPRQDHTPPDTSLTRD